jgi:hypothetical protein
MLGRVAAQMKSWKSQVYSHFKSPPDIFIEKGVVKYRYICKSYVISYSIPFQLIISDPRNPSQTIIRVRSDDSTSNLNRHVTRCAGHLPQSGQAINDFAHGSTYTKAEFRYLSVVWVSQCHRPFAIVNDEPLQRMFRMLYAKVDIPSPTTLSRDVKEVHDLAKQNVAKVLQVCCHVRRGWFSR